MAANLTDTDLIRFPFETLQKSDLTCVRRRLLALLPNLTDLKCDVWENAVATWSPEPLLIRPIRGETETIRLRQDGASSGLWVEDPLRTSFPSLNLSQFYRGGFSWSQ